MKRSPSIQFRLRALFWALLLASLPLAPLSCSREERAAVEAIERAGGRVVFVQRLSNGGLRPYMGAARGSAIRRAAAYLYGNELLDDPIGVGFFGARFDDAALSEATPSLRRLRSLRHLELYGVAVTDDGLQHLETLSSLTYLSLQNTRVSAAGVEALRVKLPNCEVVD